MNDKSLYNKDARYTDLGTALDKKAYEVLKPIFAEYVSFGCNIREIAHIIQGTLTEIELVHVLNWDDNHKQGNE